MKLAKKYCVRAIILQKPQPLVAATLLLQKAFAVLWDMIPQNEESEPSDEMSSVQGVCKT